MADLCEPLHDAFTNAEQSVRTRLPEVLEPPYAWLRTHNVRGAAHWHLTRSDLGSWSLAGNHARNGELWLSDGNYRVRILHGPSEKDVPAPGANTARQAYFSNPPLFEMPPLFGDPNDRLITLWRIDPESSAVSFRVVRPIGNWDWGGQAKIDLDFPLPSHSEELFALKFDPSDEDLELALPKEETDYGYGSGGGTG